MQRYDHTTNKPIPLATDDLIARFFALVDTTGDCWNWQGSRRGMRPNCPGYGVLCITSSNYSTHRLSYAWFVGDPTGKCVCHRCDNPLCVNPAHLFLGSNRDNMLDQIAKGRKRVRRGEENNKAKLTKANVLAIRRLAAAGKLTYEEIARAFDVVRTDIGQIARGDIWAHVGGPRTHERPIRSNAGIRGISWDPSRRRYQVYGDHHGKRVSLGRTVSLSEAIARRKQFEDEIAS